MVEDAMAMTFGCFQVGLGIFTVFKSKNFGRTLPLLRAGDPLLGRRGPCGRRGPGPWLLNRSL